MVCTHLKELYDLCEEHQIRIGGSDLIRIVCKQCDQDETCPSVLMDEYDSRHADDEPASDSTKSAPGDSQQA